MHNTRKKSWAVLVSVIILTAATFFMDLQLPLGIAGGVPYVGAVLVSLWFYPRKYTWYVAITCSVLTIMGFYLSPPGGALWVVLTNRFLALLAVWATAILGLQRKKVLRILSKKTKDLDKRVKELNCLYGLSRLVEQPNISLEEIFQGTANLIPPSWQYPDIISARIIFEGKEFMTENFKKTQKKYVKDIKVHGKHVGTIEVNCLEGDFGKNKGTILKNEDSLMDAIAERLGKIVEQKQTEKMLGEHQQKLEISQINLKEFSWKILKIREEEKKILANNLHDEVGSMAVSLSASLGIAEAEIKDNNFQGALKSILHAKKDLKKEVVNFKKIAVGLRPPNLDTVGLSGALREYFSDVTKQVDLKVEFDIDIDERKINEDISIALYRITQEALNNIIKYAKTKKAIIKLYYKRNEIRFDIRDEGKGFDVEKIFRETRTLKMGIQGMKERVESLGGTFALESAIKNGTRIDISFPLKDNIAREKNLWI